MKDDLHVHILSVFKTHSTPTSIFELNVDDLNFMADDLKLTVIYANAISFKQMKLICRITDEILKSAFSYSKAV